MSSYQCSPHSTAEGIINVFKQCSRFQKRKDLKTFTSVVVLDEVGLAEDSPQMPLKALHPLLEDGTDNSEDLTVDGFLLKNEKTLDEAGHVQVSPEISISCIQNENKVDGPIDLTADGTSLKNERVAFIGISNWALDPSKMNRGIMLYRRQLGLHQLTNTARYVKIILSSLCYLFFHIV